VTTVISKAGRKPSQVLRTQNETSEKARAIPGEKERVDNQRVGSGKEETTQEILFFPFLTGHCRQRPRRADSVRTLTLTQPLPVFPRPHPQAPSGRRECSFSIYQNLARFSIHFQFPLAV